MNITEWTLEEVYDFLEALDASDVEVSNWEAGFVESIMSQLDNENPFLSVKQRRIVQNLVTKYNDQLK